jgi:ketosteroid isomerase-like protein
MANSESATALLAAINFDRFDEIAAWHTPDVEFRSFRGPALSDSMAVGDWHRDFLQQYADCRYEDAEIFDDGDAVCVRANIVAKGYDWRPFQQPALEVMQFRDDRVAFRRLYGMLRDVELGKAETAALKAAQEYPGAKARATKKAVSSFYEAAIGGDDEKAIEQLDEKAALIDAVYGTANGPQEILELMKSIPAPAFGQVRVTAMYAGPKDAVVEQAIEPSRPRSADWVRMLEGKIKVIERFWMLREIGVNPFEEYSRDRHSKAAIPPI